MSHEMITTARTHARAHSSPCTPRRMFHFHTCLLQVTYTAYSVFKNAVSLKWHKCVSEHTHMHRYITVLHYNTVGISFRFCPLSTVRENNVFPLCLMLDTLSFIISWWTQQAVSHTHTHTHTHTCTLAHKYIYICLEHAITCVYVNDWWQCHHGGWRILAPAGAADISVLP